MTNSDHTPARWLQPRWLETAQAWIDAVLAARGAARSGAISQPHVRPWSTVLRVPTTLGVLWFKANAGGTRYEPALLDLLGRLRPGDVVVPLAVDVERAWSLQPDGGTTLRDSGSTGLRLQRWERALADYATLQRAVAGHAAAFIAAGVPDMRPTALPARRAEFLEAAVNGLSAESCVRLQAAAPDFAEACAVLDGSGIPPTLQHDDLHDGNIFVDGERHRFFDWGDASIAHPFGSLLATRTIAQHLGIPEHGPEVERLQAAYLEVWSDLADRTTLRRAVVAALRVTTVSKTLAWRRALADAEPGSATDYAGRAVGWLEEW